MQLPALLAAHILIGCTVLLCLSLAICAAGRLLLNMIHHDKTDTD